MPKRIQRKRTKGWKMPPNTEVVDRTTMFGNPFRIHRATSTSVDGETEVWLVISGPHIWTFTTKLEATEAAIKLFRGNVEHEANALYREKVKLALRGKDLACFCPLDQPCHADILLEIANGKLGG